VRIRPRRPESIAGFNFTPLIDVMFLLTIFFMLVARFTVVEQVSMELPHPEDSRAAEHRINEPIVINCRLSEGAAIDDAQPIYSLGANPPETLETIAPRLAHLKESTPNLHVLIRADRRLPYSAVRDAMRETARCGIRELHVAVITEAESDRASAEGTP